MIITVQMTTHNDQLWIWKKGLGFRATFNNISAISWRSVLLVEETGVPGENDQPATSDWQNLSYNVVSSTPRLSEIRTHNSYEYEEKRLIHNKKTDKGQA
jgi:hypothetical protein